MGSNPSQPVAVLEKPQEKQYHTKLKLMGLSPRTIETYLSSYHKFIESGQSPEQFILQSKNKRNNIAMLKILYPDLKVKFPKRVWKPKILPSKTQLKTFYDALPDQYKPIFLLLAESGLRIGELLDCEIDKSNKMLIPKGHTGQTKHSFISFYVTEFDSIPKFNVDSVSHAFLKTSHLTGIKVYPHLLRSVFVREASMGGMPSHYIDVFCGRVPQSVLARSYTDYSPETLKSLYSKAKIKIFD